MKVTTTLGPITYIGYDPSDNGKRWIEEIDNYTYVIKQENEWSQSYVPIVAYDKEYLFKEAYPKRYDIPPSSIEEQIINGKTAYFFWMGKDYWFMCKNEAIKFIHDKWDRERKR